MSRTRGDRAEDFTRRVATTLAFLEFLRDCEDAFRDPKLVAHAPGDVFIKSLESLRIVCLWKQMALRYHDRLVGLRGSGYLRAIEPGWWDATLGDPSSTQAREADRVPRPARPLSRDGDRQSAASSSRTRNPNFQAIISVSFGPPRESGRRAEARRGSYHEPPRSTRASPVGGPVGSALSAGSYGPYQSQHHSQTLPCMSCRPKRVGRPEPDRLDRVARIVLEPGMLRRALPGHRRSCRRPALPARQAYSHSASVGRR